MWEEKTDDTNWGVFRGKKKKKKKKNKKKKKGGETPCGGHHPKAPRIEPWENGAPFGKKTTSHNIIV